MKREKKEKAIILRQQGASVKAIAKQLKVSKGSVSIWVRDIKLSDSQKEQLKENSRWGSIKAAHKLMANARKVRAKYQEEGRLKVQENDAIHLAGCMLYWAEGAKSRNSLGFSNSDFGMILFFKKFLDMCFGLTTGDYTICVHCYTDFHTKDEIENYWLRLLSLPKSCLRKGSVNRNIKDKYSKNKRHGFLEWGVCNIRVNKSVRIVQHIYGAIQEYSGQDNALWLQ